MKRFSREDAIRRVRELCDELDSTHEERSRKYGFEGDPLYNFRGSEEYAIHPWIGAQIRRQDKVRRGQRLAQDLRQRDRSLGVEEVGKLKSDLLEGALYDLLTILLLEEEYGVAAVSDPNEGASQPGPPPGTTPLASSGVGQFSHPYDAACWCLTCQFHDGRARLTNQSVGSPVTTTSLLPEDDEDEQEEECEIRGCWCRNPFKIDWFTVPASKYGDPVHTDNYAFFAHPEGQDTKISSTVNELLSTLPKEGPRAAD